MKDVSAIKHTLDQVIEAHPEAVRQTLSADLMDVAKWLKCKPHQLALRKASLPAETFRELVSGLVESYDHLPGERKRMKKILNEIKNGAPLLPIFIEEDDPENFIMEGRHRIVAFLMAGLSAVPVLFASKVKRALDLNEPAP